MHKPMVVGGRVTIHLLSNLPLYMWPLDMLGGLQQGVRHGHELKLFALPESDLDLGANYFF